ncbi:hypothetical protein D3C87_1705530 [compost metagenome]
MATLCLLAADPSPTTNRLSAESTKMLPAPMVDVSTVVAVPVEGEYFSTVVEVLILIDRTSPAELIALP